MNLRRSLRSYLLSGAFLLAGIPVGVIPAQAQSGIVGEDFHAGIRTALGYSGVIPDARLGAGIVHLIPERRLGVFAEAKFTNDSVTGEDNYCPEGARPPVVTACAIDVVQQRWNDIRLRDLDEHVLVNAGGILVVSPELALLLGGGMARSRLIREFSENINRGEGEEPRVSEFGVYFVPEEENPGWTPQLVVGALLRAGPRFILRVGYETAPGGMSIGAYFVVR